MSTLKRAKKASEIAPDLLKSLNSGDRATCTYLEMTAIDFSHLLAIIAPEFSKEKIQGALEFQQKRLGITERMKAAGELLAKTRGLSGYSTLCHHKSDTVRGWAAYLLAALPKLKLAEKLAMIEPLADDPHFGVREWAWLALRPQIAEEIELSLQLLLSWTGQNSSNLRRFAVESTRPRGFWSKHIQKLKDHPALGLPLLTPLRNDPARYVQLAVGNWLNDAGKHQPQWVRQLCAKWSRDEDRATAFIVKRAQRSF